MNEDQPSVKKLTVKQLKWLERYVETGNALQSALAVYDTDNYYAAGQIGHENLKKLEDPIKMLMEAKGLTVGLLLDKVKEGLDATRATNASILLSEGGAITKSEDEGIIEVPDYLTRHRYVETAARWIGLGKEQAPTTLVQVNVKDEIEKDMEAFKK